MYLTFGHSCAATAVHTNGVIHINVLILIIFYLGPPLQEYVVQVLLSIFSCILHAHPSLVVYRVESMLHFVLYLLVSCLRGGILLVLLRDVVVPLGLPLPHPFGGVLLKLLLAIELILQPLVFHLNVCFLVLQDLRPLLLVLLVLLLQAERALLHVKETAFTGPSVLLIQILRGIKGRLGLNILN